MIIHEAAKDNRGAGRWELTTTRYIPVSGGSRSRLPIGFPEVRRYYGFVGVDERLSERMSTISALYTHLGGRYQIPEGQEGSYMSLVLAQAKKWILPAKEGNGG